jgi:hypothetical protein
MSVVNLRTLSDLRWRNCIAPRTPTQSPQVHTSTSTHTTITLHQPHTPQAHSRLRLILSYPPDTYDPRRARRRADLWREDQHPRVPSPERDDERSESGGVVLRDQRWNRFGVRMARWIRARLLGRSGFGRNVKR